MYKSAKKCFQTLLLAYLIKVTFKFDLVCKCLINTHPCNLFYLFKIWLYFAHIACFAVLNDIAIFRMHNMIAYKTSTSGKMADIN